MNKGIALAALILFVTTYSAAGYGSGIDGGDIVSEEEYSPPDDIRPQQTEADFSSALAEALQLISDLENEIALTNKIIELRSDKGVAAPSAAETTEPEGEVFAKAPPAEPVIDAAAVADTIKLFEDFAREVEGVGALMRGGAEVPKSPAEERGAAVGTGAAGIFPAAKGEGAESGTALPAETMVVARQVSQDASRSLPRESRSGITDERSLAGASGIRKKSERAAKTYKSGQLDRLGEGIELERESTVRISVPGLKRFMVTDADIVKAAKPDGNTIELTGVKLGQTFMHIWDDNGRRTLGIRVVQKGREVYIKAAKRAIEAKKMQSFKTRYSFDRYRLNAESLNPGRSFHYAEWFHRLSTTGETPWGFVDSRLQYEGKEEGMGIEDKRDLTAWDFNLRGKDIEVSMGNTAAYFSDITLPQTGYQGIRFRNPDDKNVRYDLVYGARGERIWGKKVGDFEDGNYFYGARGEVTPADYLDFNATILRSLGNDLETSEYVYATGMGVDLFDDAVTIDAEAARSKNGVGGGLSDEGDSHAYKVDTRFDLKKYNADLMCTFRDIGSDFDDVTGATISHVGELGAYLKGNYIPLKYLRLSGNYNVFRDRLNFNSEHPKIYNYDWQGTADFNLGKGLDFKYNRYFRSHEGKSSPTRGSGEMYQVNYNFSIPNQVTLYARYSPVQYRGLGSESDSYKEEKFVSGFRFNVLKNLYYDLSHQWHSRKMILSGENGTVKTLSTGLQYATRIFDTPFYGSARLRYNREYDVMENLPLNPGEETWYGEAEIKYKPSADFETYLRVNYNHIRGAIDGNLDRQEMRIYGGGSYLFDTTVGWGITGHIQGWVFKDMNGDGEKGDDEEGVPGITIYAGEDKSTVTDKNGRFEFRKVKGVEVDVLMDVKTLPQGYNCTSANPKTVVQERDTVMDASFGLIAVSEISGRVFNDVTMNGVFDAGDAGIKDIVVSSDDGVMGLTLYTGHYRLERVEPGDRTVKIGISSVPQGFLPVEKPSFAVKVEEGKFYEVDFAFYALRTVIGTVFIDADGNGRFDSGEDGLPDVEVRCGSAVALTDAQGRYFLKKLPGGAQTVTIVPESIQQGYEISGDPSRQLDLLPEGEIREDVDFPLRPNTAR